MHTLLRGGAPVVLWLHRGGWNKSGRYSRRRRRRGWEPPVPPWAAPPSSVTSSDWSSGWSLNGLRQGAEAEMEGEGLSLEGGNLEKPEKTKKTLFF